MGVDDDVKVIGSKAGGGQIGEQAFFVFKEAAALLRQLVARAGFDEDGVIAGADGEGIHGEGQTVLRVGGDLFFPERFGNDAEHGSAIEIEGAVGEEGEFEIAKVYAVQSVFLDGCGP